VRTTGPTTVLRPLASATTRERINTSTRTELGAPKHRAGFMAAPELLLPARMHASTVAPMVSGACLPM
jgi:hypothetical protein